MRVTERLKDEARLSAGTIGGGHDPFVEGTDETRRAAHEEQMRQNRVQAAPKKRLWRELAGDQLEPLGKYLADSDGMMWERVREQVWGNGDPRAGLNEHVPDAFTLVGDPLDVLFLKKYGRREDYEGARASQARTAELRRELEANKLRSLPLQPVTLGNLEGRTLPTVREAAEIVFAKHGHVEQVDGHLVVLLPEGHARDSERDAARVLYAAAPIVLAAIAGKGDVPLVERLPDVAVLPSGGLAT